MSKSAFPKSLGQGLNLLFDRARPWRRSFFVLRTLEASRGPSAPVTLRAKRRFESEFSAYPDAVVPYLQYISARDGEQEADLRASELAERSTASATLLVEIAKFHYLANQPALGDSYLEQAKAKDPALLRIYDEEAWNQRARGNLHRELQAVQHAIDVAPDHQTRLYWRIWLGEVLIRQDRFPEAWEHLQLFPEMDPDDVRLLSAGYCAHVIGLPRESAAAYRQFAPIGAADFDSLLVARTQFESFQRAAEAARLLGSLDDTSSTAHLELSAQVELSLGHVDTALSRLRRAARRSDRQAHTRGMLAQLLELADLPDQALDAYLDLVPSERTQFFRFRAGELLHAAGRTRQAVEHYLHESELPPIPELSAEDLDPALPGLLDAARRSADSDTLRQISQRASSAPLIAASSFALAERLALGEHWKDSWAAIRFGQSDRLPSVPLTDGAWETAGAQRALHYAEWIANEPLRPELTLYESSLGAATSCNPLAICRELLSDPAHASRVHVWSIEPGTHIHPSLLAQSQVSFVRKGSPGYFRALATAGTIVNNATVDHEFIKRDGQKYLNTWHGVPWKMMGRDNRSEPFAYGNIARNFLHADYVLGPDPHTLTVLSAGHDVDELVPETFVRAGYARNDLTLNLAPDVRAAMRAQLGVSEGEHLVVFMPTWKGTFGDRVSEVEQVLQVARGLMSPGLKVAIRAHHYVSAAFRNGAAEGLQLVPEHFDTNELLGAADAIVTDFSSVLFDAAATGVPVVKHIADIGEYSAERGLYFAPEEVPGANANTLSEARELLAAALQDPAVFMSGYAAQTQRFSFAESGNSARQAIELLFGEAQKEPSLPPSGSQSVLLSTGGLPPNGITRSTRSLIASLEGSGYTPYLIPGKNTLDGAQGETLADVRRYAKVLPRVGLSAGTRMQREALYFGTGRNYVPFPLVERFLESGAQLESRRLFGRVAFHSAVEFSAYDAKNITLINYGVQIGAGRRGIVFHNEMFKEVQNRYPRLRAGLQSLGRMDFLASVSDGVRDYNAETMHEHFGVPLDKHITIENTINVSEILSLAATPLDAEDRDWYADDAAHACVVARLSPEKNHAEFFRALSTCRNELRRPVKITCLGDGPLGLELQRMIEDQGLTDIVRLRGLVPNPQAHLRAAGAMVLPSLHEGQPLVILEALTVGAAVVATDTPGSRSVLHGGAYGPLVPISEDGLVEALHRVADGQLSGSEEFDPQDFTAHSLGMFLNAIDPSRDL